MGLNLEYKEGQTPLEESEKQGLLIKSITTHGELDEFEQLNIENAVIWVIQNKFAADKILSEEFIMLLHKRMFSDVWSWAGQFRQTEKNLGVGWIHIAPSLKYLLDDIKYWINQNTYSDDEITIRFKHRLVNIHCFPNGNGRHSRLMADIIITSIFQKEIFSWGSSNLVKSGNVRKRYISAIREADHENYLPLIEFARS